MQIQITDTITEDDQNALLAGLRAYNRQFLRTTNFGDLAVYWRDESNEILGRADWQNQRRMAVY